MVRNSRVRSWFASIAVFACALIGLAAAGETQPGIQRLPWEPRLVVNTNENLCRRFDDVVRADFRAVAPGDLAAVLGRAPTPREVNDLVIAFDNVRLLDGQPANVMASAGSEDGAGAYRDFDIYMVLGGGRTAIDLSGQWRALTRTQRAGAGTVVEHPDGTKGAYIVSPQRRMRSGSERNSQRDRLTVTQQVIINETFFVLGMGAAEEVLGNLDRTRPRAEQEAEFVVFLASPLRDGGLGFACVAAIAPRPSEIAAPFVGARPTAQYLATLDQITGAIPTQCTAPGTMFGPTWRSVHVNRADHLHLVTRQPWRLPPVEDTRENSPAAFRAGYLSDGEGRRAQHLRHWSLADPVSRRHYLQLNASLAGIVTDLANYYRAGFGASDALAEDWAHRALWVLLDAAMESPIVEYRSSVQGDVDQHLSAVRIDWLALVRTAQSPEAPRRHLGRQASNPQNVAAWRGSTLGRAALADAPVDALRALTTSGDDLNARSPAGEAPLVMALGNQAALAWMIGAGADVNGRNAFDKTPLMHAAYLNLPDAIRGLLAAGAEVNAATYAEASQEESDACVFSIDSRQRTALMYAAENAGLEAIEALVRAGADVAARDSRSRDVLDYLSRNSRLTTAQREAAQRLLMQPRSPR